MFWSEFLYFTVFFVRFPITSIQFKIYIFRLCIFHVINKLLHNLSLKISLLKLSAFFTNICIYSHRCYCRELLFLPATILTCVLFSHRGFTCEYPILSLGYSQAHCMRISNNCRSIDINPDRSGRYLKNHPNRVHAQWSQLR